MKIALSGYGKMGKEVEKIALERKHDIFLKIDTEKDWETYANILPDADVVIDFSFPKTAADNIKRCFNADVPVVSGTTGWAEQLDEIKQLCLSNNKALLYASNFSIGVNIFFEINKKLAQLINKYPEYEISIEEIHHIQKLDAPSGTAIALANDIITLVDRKDKWIDSETKSPNKIGIKSMRTESVTGTHIIRYNSEIDLIEIKHAAHNRKGFALGAVLAAEWIIDKKGLFTMKDLLF